MKAILMVAFIIFMVWLINQTGDAINQKRNRKELHELLDRLEKEREEEEHE